MKLSTMENGLDEVRLDGEGLDKFDRDGEGLDEVHHKEGMVLNGVAEKSNPSNLDCIQIEISASNLMPKIYAVFVAKLVLSNFTLFGLTLSVLTKMYCKLLKSIGCSHTVYKY